MLRQSYLHWLALGSIVACSSTTRVEGSDSGGSGGSGGSASGGSTSSGASSTTGDAGGSSSAGGSTVGAGGSTTGSTGGSDASGGSSTGGSSAGGSSAGGSTSTGGSDAGGSGGSQGGTGGSPPACVDDADCDDGDDCNGIETCDGGECVRGDFDAACAGMDENHCDCVTTDDGCAIEGGDADEDGYRDIACSADDAADDCNDDCADCYPGATEVCDGLDNDCNGDADMFDGLSLYGQTDALVATGTDMRAVWWEAENLYAVMAQNTGGSTKMELFLLEVDGSIHAGPIDLTEATGGSFAFGELYPSGDQLGIFLPTPSTSTLPLLIRYDSDGEPLGTTVVDDDPPDGSSSMRPATLLSAPGGGWHGVYTYYDSTQYANIVRFDDQGETTGVDFFTYGNKVRSAESGGTYFISNYNSPNSTLATIASIGTVIDSRSDLGEINALGGGEFGFAVQYGPTDASVFAELSSDMQISCGPIDVTSYVVDHRLASTGVYWLGFTRPSGIPNLQIVENGCGKQLSLPLASSSIFNGAYGSVAASDQGALLVWRTTSESVAVRAVGPRLCDAPVE